MGNNPLRLDIHEQVVFHRTKARQIQRHPHLDFSAPSATITDNECGEDAVAMLT